MEEPAGTIEDRVGEGREYSLRRKGRNKVVTREKRGITSGLVSGCGAEKRLLHNAAQQERARLWQQGPQRSNPAAVKESHAQLRKVQHMRIKDRFTTGTVHDARTPLTHKAAHIPRESGFKVFTKVETGAEAMVIYRGNGTLAPEETAQADSHIKKIAPAKSHLSETPQVHSVPSGAVAWGPKEHLRHEVAPRHWMLDKLRSVLALVYPPLREWLPVKINRLKYALIGIKTRRVSLLFIVLCLRSQVQLCRVRKIFVSTKGIPHVMIHDVPIIFYLHPLIKVNYNIQINLETGKIINFIKFDTGNLGMVTGGANLEEIELTTNIDIMALWMWLIFADLVSNVFVIGKHNKPWISLNQGKVSASLLLKKETDWWPNKAMGSDSQIKQSSSEDGARPEEHHHDSPLGVRLWLYVKEIGDDDDDDNVNNGKMTVRLLNAGVLSSDKGRGGKLEKAWTEDSYRRSRGKSRSTYQVPTGVKRKNFGNIRIHSPVSEIFNDPKDRNYVPRMAGFESTDGIRDYKLPYILLVSQPCGPTIPPWFYFRSPGPPTAMAQEMLTSKHAIAIPYEELQNRSRLGVSRLGRAQLGNSLAYVRCRHEVANLRLYWPKSASLPPLEIGDYMIALPYNMPKDIEEEIGGICNSLYSKKGLSSSAVTYLPHLPAEAVQLYLTAMNSTSQVKVETSPNIVILTLALSGLLQVLACPPLATANTANDKQLKIIQQINIPMRLTEAVTCTKPPSAKPNSQGNKN
ncbi:hypothetical protein GH733_010553 [Mirounga leonina]|nr:hypothetical protein GH733_010553 [Mirounga leonina]